MNTNTHTSDTELDTIAQRVHELMDSYSVLPAQGHTDDCEYWNTDEIEDCTCSTKPEVERWMKCWLEIEQVIQVGATAYANRLAAERAVQAEHYWIKYYGDQRKFLDGSDGDMPQINELKRHQQLHKDRLVDLTASLQTGDTDD